MILPAAFVGAYQALAPALELVKEYAEERLAAELRGVAPARVEARVKSAESAFAKLQRGDLRLLSEMDDLVGVKAIFLHPSDVETGHRVAEAVFDVVRIVPPETPSPDDMSYKEPHLVVKLPVDYLARHSEAKDVLVEIQLTTQLQDALQRSVHAVVYKGDSFSWRKARLAAQIRGVLELIDGVLEQVEVAAAVRAEREHAAYRTRNQIVDFAKSTFHSAELPSDLRRFAITVEGMLIAARIQPNLLQELAERHPDLRDANSIAPVEKVLGMLLREHRETFVSRLTTKRRVVVSAELETLCSETNLIPDGRRVSW